jgi:5'-deoxynucleotidase YfbR-like HD superfamily hydrolase
MFKTVLVHMIESGIDTASLNSLLDLSVSLTRKKRRGWLQRGIPEQLAESVYEHTVQLRQACISYAFGRDYDPMRVYLYADIHDIVEAIAEDVTPKDNISAADKLKAEEKAIVELAERLKAPWLSVLWHDYERKDSVESMLVYQLDKVDPCIKAVAIDRAFGRIDKFYQENPKEYRNLVQIYPEKDPILSCRESLKTFYPAARKKITEPELVAVLDKAQEYEDHVYTRYYRDLMTPEGRQFARAVAGQHSPLERKLKKTLFDIRTFNQGEP